MIIILNVNDEGDGTAFFTDADVTKDPFGGTPLELPLGSLVAADLIADIKAGVSDPQVPASEIFHWDGEFEKSAIDALFKLIQHAPEVPA